MEQADEDDDSDVGPVDLTPHFWRFVSSVCHMPYDSLRDTVEYQVLDAYSQSGRQAMLLEGTVGPPLLSPGRGDGLRFDPELRAYIFDDCNALFDGLPQLMPCGSPRAELLKRCVTRMRTTIDVHDITLGMSGMS